MCVCVCMCVHVCACACTVASSRSSWGSKNWGLQESYNTPTLCVTTVYICTFTVPLKKIAKLYMLRVDIYHPVLQKSYTTTVVLCNTVGVAYFPCTLEVELTCTVSHKTKLNGG